MKSSIMVFLLLAAAGTAQATTYTVHPDGSGDFPTIQAAMYAATTGDVIQLGNGVFTGPDNRNLDTNETTFSVVSMSGNPDSCVINCQGSESNPQYGIEYSTQGAEALLRGISIINAYSNNSGGALLLSNASITVENCNFKSNRALNFGGAVFGNDWSSPTFTDCLFRSNIAYNGKGGAVHLEDNAEPLFQGCTFDGNMASSGGALSFNLGSSAEVNDCTIEGSVANAIDVGSDGDLYLIQSIVAFNQGFAVTGAVGSVANAVCCDVFGNSSGNYFSLLAGQGNTAGNLEVDPVFCNAGQGNFTLHSSSPCTAANNQDCGQIGAWPVGCWTTLTVAPDGSGDFPTIQAAIDAAVSGVDEVLLLDGIFSGNGNRDIDFLGKAITVRSASGNPAACIINCNGSAAYTHFGFMFMTGEGENSILRGVTVKNGWAGMGSAIYISESSPHIEDCIFRDNVGSYGSIMVVTGSPVIRDCEFLSNRYEEGGFFGGAISGHASSSITLDGCLFDDNGDPILQPAVGGAIYMHMDNGSRISNCVFRNNHAYYGGVVLLTNNIATTTFDGCTFVGNVGVEGSVLNMEGEGDVQFLNSIVAFNTNDQWLSVADASPVTIDCSDIYGNEGGDWIGPVAGQEASPSNISLDPKFCDAANGDFSLEATSPCLPFTEPNRFCELVGAEPLGCDYRGMVTSVADVPNDQGRRVRLSWNASPQDASGAPYSITGYSVWRLINDPVRKAVPAPEGQAERMNRFPAGDWDYITTVPARGESKYSMVCPTLADSTVAGGMHYSTFFVSAQTAIPTLFFDAAPDSGYSVDNLAPSVPQNLRLQTPDLLAWDDITTPDFNYFTAYGSQSDVLDGTEVALGTTVGLTMDLQGDGFPYYLVTATDFSGNEGQPAVVASGITGVGDGAVRPTRFALYPAWPNPGTGSTTFSFDLPQASKVNLSVYDLAGRRVATLVNAEMPAGTHLVPWQGRAEGSQGPLASGVYFYRLQAGGFSGSGRVVILK